MVLLHIFPVLVQQPVLVHQLIGALLGSLVRVGQFPTNGFGLLRQSSSRPLFPDLNAAKVPAHLDLLSVAEVLAIVLDILDHMVGALLGKVFLVVQSAKAWLGSIVPLFSSADNAGDGVRNVVGIPVESWR